MSHSFTDFLRVNFIWDSVKRIKNPTSSPLSSLHPHVVRDAIQSSLPHIAPCWPHWALNFEIPVLISSEGESLKSDFVSEFIKTKIFTWCLKRKNNKRNESHDCSLLLSMKAKETEFLFWISLNTSCCWVRNYYSTLESIIRLKFFITCTFVIEFFYISSI